MSEHQQSDGAPEVGSVGEEAAKLFEALQDWARDSGTGPTGAAAAAAAGAASAARDVGEHLAGEDCRYCPVCRVIAAARGTSPEVRAHLASAATSLVQAAAGLLETHVPERRPKDSPVERIDLDAEPDQPDEPGAPSWEDD